ncbi:MAG TPA: efflux transporter outer membrane subunit [Burkholderiales bacterium]|nr:efflux transporter outer membrane subunit [Burkholderiales bacterium]
MKRLLNLVHFLNVPGKKQDQERWISRVGLCRLAPGFVLIIALSACAVGPKYVPPALMVPTHFKEKQGWFQAPLQDRLFHGDWWAVFNDPVLDRLEPQVAKANQSLRAAYYAYRQARALTGVARAQYYPVVGATLSASRSDSNAVVSSSGQTGFQSGPANEVSLGLSASWEADLWGRIHGSVQASEAGAEASQGDLLAAQLSLQGTLAQSYFQLLQVRNEIRLAQSTVSSYQQTLKLTINRYAAGVATKADVAQAQTQLATSRVQLASLGVQRSQLEHALAVLVGQPPSAFRLPSLKPVLPAAPFIPAGVPAQLLLRRPDLFAAERRVAQANAQIGVAKSAFFPALTLSAQPGWRSTSFDDLLSAPNLFWSLGPSLAATLFDGGAREAQLLQSRAAYQETVAQYRQAFLLAMQQAEDNLAALDILRHEAKLQQQAVDAASESLRLAINQYRAGTAPYLNVLTAQTAFYTARNAALQIHGQRLTDTVVLIQALGGGWGDGIKPELGPLPVTP